MNVVLLGPQGSGKGTQAELLVKEFGLFYIEMGDMLRNAAKVNPIIDKLINEQGKLVPDNVAFSLVVEKVEKEKPQKDGILFDGFPRSIPQYQMLVDWLKDSGKEIDMSILIDVTEEESIRRLSGRRIDPATDEIYNLVTNPPPSEVDVDTLVQREDDKPEAIKARLKLYEEVTGPLVRMLDDQGILKRVGGERPIEIIREEIERVIKSGN